MSDPVVPYTPTDEEVRESYWVSSSRLDEALAEIDRYLAARDARVREEQREADAKIAEQDHTVPGGADSSGRIHYYLQRKYPTDGPAIAAAIRGGKP